MVPDRVAGGGRSSMSGWMMYASFRQLADTVVKMLWILVVYVVSHLWRTLYLQMYGLAGITEHRSLWW